jgi:hypothetical protein
MPLSGGALKSSLPMPTEPAKWPRRSSKATPKPS